MKSCSLPKIVSFKGNYDIRVQEDERAVQIDKVETKKAVLLHVWRKIKQGDKNYQNDPITNVENTERCRKSSSKAKQKDRILEVAAKKLCTLKNTNNIDEL